ncbi:MAG: BrnT family toxin [Acidobacteriales bacterium]|nr:BrnT family toxin [Terriglobales bacterium]
MFDWDRNNLCKIRAHRIRREEVEQALQNDPVPIYEQDVGGEPRYVYYGETNAGRLLAVVVTERGTRIRVVTAYDLDAGQKRDYLRRRLHGEWIQ